MRKENGCICFKKSDPSEVYVTYVGGKGVCVCVCVCVCVRVCGGGWSVLQIFQKLFRSPGDHRAKYFIAPLIILVSCLRLLAVVFQGRIHVSIQRTKGANICNNIQTVIFTGVLHEILKLIFKITRSRNV